MSHTHGCVHCGTPVECYGEMVENHDGWPAVICEDYHLPNGLLNPECLCNACGMAEDVERSRDAQMKAEGK